MTSVSCLLLISFIFQSYPPFVTAHYLLETLQPTGSTDKNTERLSKAIYLFTIDLHQKIHESSIKENVFFSPASIYVALAMLYSGSGGKTKTQLESVLHLDVFEDENEFDDGIKLLLQTIGSTKKTYTLEMANRLFGQKEFMIKDEYRRKTKEYFGAQLESLDFMKETFQARKQINDWVSKMTLNKIKELFSQGTITSDTVLVLANAVYFNGSWLYKFNKTTTKPESFAVSKQKKIKVHMMHLLHSAGLRYSTCKELSFKLLELPYSDSSLSMIIALDEGMGDFETLLRGKPVDNSSRKIVDVLTKVPVRLSLPKFSLHRTLNLKKPLYDLGMKNLFTAADLSGITDSRPLELSEAIHKAYIAVDEEGTVATAATGVIIRNKSRPSGTTDAIDFVVDRPFVFLVMEKTTGSILFFGHIKNPLKSD